MSLEQRQALRLYQEWEEESPSVFRSTSSGLVHTCRADTCTFYFTAEADSSGDATAVKRICAISGRALELHPSKRSRN
ncbi:hypothetical protein BASA81_002340 [Batrachochytrium salamandrivorans]|nr:hypothetical protein BASA81_002340 [Batrachochytrium salamandrivorans]